MNLTLTIALGVALLIGVGACTIRSFTVECPGPDAVTGPAECHDVADHVAPRVGQARAQLGRLIVVSVEAVHCRTVSMTQEIPEVAAPSIDRCWQVILDYEGGEVWYVAARDGNTGGIGLFE